MKSLPVDGGIAVAARGQQEIGARGPRGAPKPEVVEEEDGHLLRARDEFVPELQPGHGQRPQFGPGHVAALARGDAGQAAGQGEIEGGPAVVAQFQRLGGRLGRAEEGRGRQGALDAEDAH